MSHQGPRGTDSYSPAQRPGNFGGGRITRNQVEDMNLKKPVVEKRKKRGRGKK